MIAASITESKGARVYREDWDNHRLGQHVFDSAIGKVADNATLLEAGVAVNWRLVGWLPKRKKTTSDQGASGDGRGPIAPDPVCAPAARHAERGPNLIAQRANARRRTSQVRLR